jgi:hypothetical protein
LKKGRRRKRNERIKREPRTMILFYIFYFRQRKKENILDKERKKRTKEAE